MFIGKVSFAPSLLAHAILSFLLVSMTLTNYCYNTYKCVLVTESLRKLSCFEKVRGRSFYLEFGHFSPYKSLSPLYYNKLLVRFG